MEEAKKNESLATLDPRVDRSVAADFESMGMSEIEKVQFVGERTKSIQRGDGKWMETLSVQFNNRTGRRSSYTLEIDFPSFWDKPDSSKSEYITDRFSGLSLQGPPTVTADDKRQFTFRGVDCEEIIVTGENWSYYKGLHI